jgi:hypothetical protein
MTALLRKCWQWFIHRDAAEREAFFSGATDRVDLERRIREWERGHLGLRS